MTNKLQFGTVYAEVLAAHKAKNPEAYCFPANLTIEEVTARMLAAFENGTASVTGTATKNACRLLGIKPTVKAIKEYLAA